MMAKEGHLPNRQGEIGSSINDANNQLQMLDKYERFMYKKIHGDSTAFVPVSQEDAILTFLRSATERQTKGGM